MDRTILSEEHELFRRSFRTFLERDVVPNQIRWIEADIVDREIFLRTVWAARSSRSAGPTP